MRYLLDTHVLLWYLADDKKLPKATKRFLSDPEHIIFVSSVSAFEIAIKKSIGSLETPDNLEEVVADCGFERLPLSFAHAKRLEMLPMHHRDPFDRLLVAQAMVERLTFITHDKLLKEYDVSIKLI